MNTSILLTETQFNNNGEWIKGGSDDIQEVTAENILRRIKARFNPSNDITMEITDEDIQKWLEKVEKCKDSIDYDDEKYLDLITVKYDEGYAEYELEHFIEE